MFEQYSYKIKLRALLVLFIMLAVAAYKRSFSTLIYTLKEHNSLSDKVETIKRKTKNTSQLQSEIMTLDKMIGKEGFDKERVQQEIVAFLLQNSKLSISDMQPVHEFKGENYTVSTFQLDLTGNYNDLVSIVYKFERQFDYCKVVNTKFYTEKNTNKNTVLHLKLIFQKYENNK